MQLSVNPSQRHAKMRAHTATHLLHALIQDYIPTTQQAGSLVDNDYVRFDYTSDDMLTSAQISEINTKINEIIWLGREVTTTEMSIDEALATGAKAFFQDKYGDVVRVVQVLWDDTLTSVELCGGTHVSNTREIGAFVIVEQSPVASGTKRIVAYTWPKTLEYSSSLEENLQSIASKLDCSPKQIDERLGKTLKDYEEAKKELKGRDVFMVDLWIDRTEYKTTKDWEYKIMSLSDDDSYLWLLSLNSAVELIKQKKLNVILYHKNWSFAVVWWSNAKEFSQSYGLRWGWSESVFQWKDSKIHDIILKII